jgi:hypothetical protein
VESVLKAVPIKKSMVWNCQNWVQEGLNAMVTAGLINNEQRDLAIWRQKEAISTPFTTESPNKQAFQD